MSSRSAFLLACGVALVAGCASYTPAPLSAAARAREIQERSLNDPRLRRFVAAVVRDGPSAETGAAEKSATWNLATLTLAALYYHPSLSIARARFHEAQAAVRTARALPNPSLGFEDLSHSLSGPAAWTVSPVIDFLIETAGKRARRTEEARALTDAALADLATASWQVRAGVRDGLLDSWAAQRRLVLLRRRISLQEQLVTLLEHRFAVGEASALDVSRERVSANQLRLALRSAERQAIDARIQLAGAIGIPAAALDGASVSFDGLEQPRAPANDAVLRREALTKRSDVQSMLAQYAAAESALALEIANQYPDLTLGPGYSFDSIQDRYILLPQVELPVFNRNGGAIAAALARRDEAAARFTALQIRVMDAVDGAMADYHAASASLATADAVLREEQDRESRSVQSFRAGALDRPSLLSVEIERSVAEQSRFDTLVEQRRALGALEDALEHPLYFPRARWLAPSADPHMTSPPRS